MLAVLTEEDRERLKRLALHPRVHLIVVSGRDRRFISQQFSGIPLDLAAEQGGFFFDRAKGAWSCFVKPALDNWIKQAREIFACYYEKAPGSYVEEKELSVVWHYRKAEELVG